MTATRPVTTPNLYFAPPCAKPADHHDTPHKDGRLFNATQKNNHTAPSNDTLRTRIDRHNASDMRGQAESRRVHWAWRGRDSPAPQEHGGALGSCIFSSVECMHRTIPRGYYHGTFHRVAFLSCVLFSRHAVGSCGGRRLALCDVAERPRAMTPDAASERR